MRGKARLCWLAEGKEGRGFPLKEKKKTEARGSEFFLALQRGFLLGLLFEEEAKRAERALESGKVIEEGLFFFCSCFFAIRKEKG